MGKMTYRELLLDPRWQKVRLKKLEASEWRCECCYDHEVTLSVHHKRYVKGRMPWEYKDHELAVLCQPCHEFEHEAKELRYELIACLHVDGPACADDFFAVGAGYIGEQTNDNIIPTVVAQFAEGNPYQVECGRFLAAILRRFNLTEAGLRWMSDALLLCDPDSELFTELYALFSKHGVLAKRRSE